MRVQQWIIKNAWLVVLVALAAFTRLDELAYHFTHVDDAHVAASIRDQYTKPRPTEHPLVEAVNRYLDAGKEVYRTSTYAPFGGFMSALFVRSHQDYRQTLFWWRLPFALFGILVLMLSALLAHQLAPSRKQLAGLMAGGWMLFAWQNIIYSQQMTPYVYAQLAALAVLYSALRFGALTKPGLWAQLLLWGLFAWAFHLSYQVLALLPAMLWVAYWPQRPHWTRPAFWLAFALGLALCIGLIGHLLHRLLFTEWGQLGVNSWNVGPNRAFLFDTNGQDALYPLRFFATNTWHVLQGLLGSQPPGTTWAAGQTVSLLLLLGLGIRYLAHAKPAPLRLLAQFALLTALGWLVFIVSQKFTYSPTRHSMLLTPYIVLLATCGVLQLTVWLQPLGKKAAIAGALMCLAPHGLGFVAGYAQERAQRRDRFEPTHFLQIVKQWQPQGLYGYTLSKNPLFVPELQPLMTQSKRVLTHTPPGAHYLFFSHQRPLDDEAWYYALNSAQGMRLPGSRADYNTVYTFANFAPVQIDYSPLTQNGHNGCYITVICSR